MAVAGSTEISVFLDGGRGAAGSIRDILRKNGIAMGDLKAILDFGCGCGRVLRLWKDVAGTELHGTDYNPELAAWCARHLPFVRIGTNGLAPPTGYPAARFDLIYALSVFTHLPETAQMEWMNEFHRILRPGGFLLLSLHGAHYLSRLNDRERRRFLDGGLVTRSGRGAGTNLCSTFHPEAYVRHHLTGDFEVVDFIPEGARGNPRQDAWLFRRRPT
jgi:SAM-dependent methyltransferase